MPDEPRPKLWHLTRTLWGIVAFLLGFAVLLVVVIRQYLMPAFAAAAEADPDGRQQLAAVSTLLLAVLLAIIVIGLILTFRVRRFFLPRTRAGAGPTQYTDAWTESGKRAK